MNGEIPTQNRKLCFFSSPPIKRIIFRGTRNTSFVHVPFIGKEFLLIWFSCTCVHEFEGFEQTRFVVLQRHITLNLLLKMLLGNDSKVLEIEEEAKE